jgi:hypothetical protein
MPKKGTPKTTGTGTGRGRAAKGKATEAKPPSGMETGAATATLTARAAPTHDQIAQRARAIWERRGCPHGQDREIWLEAEAQLAQETQGK